MGLQKVLSHFPSPEAILKAGTQGLITFLKSCPGLSLKSIRTKTEALLSVASERLEMAGPNPSFSQILLSNIKLIFAISEQIHQAKVQINELAQSIPDIAGLLGKVWYPNLLDTMDGGYFQLSFSLE